jgi:Mce-associated membrane protein
MSSESEAPLDDAAATEEADSAVTDAAATEEADSAKARADSSGELETTGAIDRAVSSLLTHWRPALLLTSVVASVALAAFLFLTQYLPDRKVDASTARQVIAAASDGAVAALSYSSDSLDRDFATARSHLTGDFLAYYDKFTKDFVVPGVRDKHLTQSVVVVRAAVSELDANSAVVLVFLNETTANKDKKEPLMTPTSVRITLTKVGGSWLISKLDPYG